MGVYKILKRLNPRPPPLFCPGGTVHIAYTPGLFGTAFRSFSVSRTVPHFRRPVGSFFHESPCRLHPYLTCPSQWTFPTESEQIHSTLNVPMNQGLVGARAVAKRGTQVNSTMLRRLGTADTGTYHRRNSFRKPISIVMRSYEKKGGRCRCALQD